MRKSDTIFALSSGVGKAGVAMVRASGPGVRLGLDAMAGGPPPPREARLRRLIHPRTGEEVDRGIVLFFPAPNSFTGEDMAEFHVHGGRAVLTALLDALGDLAGWRIADRGEFTRRALEAGKFDLAAAEGLADLIDAQTAGQRRQALHQMGGHIERATENWRERLLTTLALIEAEVDFPDEDDVVVSKVKIIEICKEVKTEVEQALERGRAGERLRDGLKVVIAGPPNVGKSTLFNALAEREAALVSPIPGTTRDVIEVALDLEGYPILLSDTAGLRSTNDPVEVMGVARAGVELAAADLVLWLAEPGDNTPPPRDLTAPILRIRTKADRFEPLILEKNKQDQEEADFFNLSALTGQGLLKLLDRLKQESATLMAGAEGAVVTRARHRAHLTEVADHLRQAIAASDQLGPECLAEDLRLALRAMGRLTGRVDVEEVLDAIFRQFCIGK